MDIFFITAISQITVKYGFRIRLEYGRLLEEKVLAANRRKSLAKKKK